MFKKMNSKKIMFKMDALILAIAITCVCFFGFVSCGDEDKSGGGASYDPSKPVVLTSFHPDSGGIASKVIFDGENFGSDPGKIKVYFNQKPAPVIGSSGKRMYAVVPRLPGDTCVVSVVVGDDSVVYDQKFRYKISVTVSTMAGNGTKDIFQVGALDQTILWPCGLCIDNDGNLFAVTRNDKNSNAEDAFIRINEEDNSVITLGTNAMYGIRWTGSPCVDVNTGIISFPDDSNRDRFFTFDPKEGWACRTRYMKWKETTTALPSHTWHKSTASCTYDGCYYSLFYDGHLVKTDPKTYETEIIYVIPAMGDAYGLVFHPKQPKMLYLSYWSGAGSVANSICSVDITDPAGTFQKLSGAVNGGYRDGELSVAQFNQPGQIFFDAEGNLYITDSGNHCIRRLNTETNMVETVVGMPGTAGWKDGKKDEALFNTPRGITVGVDGTIYVSDWNNARIRKLAIE
jgi:hypothetical protein